MARVSCTRRATCIVSGCAGHRWARGSGWPADGPFSGGFQNGRSPGSPGDRRPGRSKLEEGRPAPFISPRSPTRARSSRRFERESPTSHRARSVTNADGSNPSS
jgi:hypothetical protein